MSPKAASEILPPGHGTKFEALRSDLHPRRPRHRFAAPQAFLHTDRQVGRNLVHNLLDVAVVSMTDAVKGEVPVAFVIERSPGTANEAEIKDFFIRNGAPYMHPRRVFILAEMPLTSAKKVDRVAWISYEEGKRNVFTAAGPTFAVVRATSFLKDDGVALTGLKISDDGSTLVFVRGHAMNNVGWVANPGGDPNGTERAIWAVKVATPGLAKRLAEGSNPEVAPDGSSVVYMKEGQIYRARIGVPVGAA